MDQEQPTNAQILAMLREQEARVDEQQRRLAQQEARTAQLETENCALKATTQRVEAENLELKAELKANAQRVDAELERQRLEKLSLTSRVNDVEGGPAPQDKKLSRAGLFKAAAMGSAAVVGAQALGTLSAQNAAAETIDTDFIANGASTNFDARGTTMFAFDTSFGVFSYGGVFRGSAYGVDAFGVGASSIGLAALGGKYGASVGSSGSSGVPLHMAAGILIGPPTTGAHSIGEIYVDSTGRIHHCVIAGTPGTWVPLNALVPISPVRVLDTRTGTSTGPYPTGTTLNVTVAGQTFATSSGTFTFPSNIVGVVGNLVAVTPTGAGYLIAYPQGATLPTAASVNFVPPGTGADIYYSIGNSVTVALSASGQLSIYMGLVPAATVQIVLDIAGYLV